MVFASGLGDLYNERRPAVVVVRETPTNATETHRPPVGRYEWWTCLASVVALCAASGVVVACFLLAS